MKLKIDNNVPLVEKGYAVLKQKISLSSVFKKMKVVQSVFIPVKNKVEIRRIAQSARYTQRCVKKRYTYRTVRENNKLGVRVWRVS